MNYKNYSLSKILYGGPNWWSKQKHQKHCLQKRTNISN